LSLVCALCTVQCALKVDSRFQLSSRAGVLFLQ